jgi:hypothetical protein
MPVTTYQLMWHDIICEIKNVDFNNLYANKQSADYYMNYHFKCSNQNQTRIKA